MENFYRKIKDKISNPPQTSTDWQVWDKISGEIESNSKGIPLWWWVTAAAMIGGVVGYFLHFHDDKSLPLENMVYVTDTVYIEKETMFTDTIYMNRYLSPTNYNIKELENLPQYAAIQNRSKILEKEIAELQNELNVIGHTILQSGLSRDARLKPIVDNYVKRNSVTDIPFFEERSLMENQAFLDSELYLARLERRTPIVRNIIWEHLLESQKGESFFEKLVPDYYNIGVVLNAPGMSFHNGLRPGLDLGAGLQLEALFSPEWSIAIGIQGRMSVGSTENQTKAMNFPQPQNTGENSRFEKLTIISKFIDVPLAVKYRIRQNQKWDLFLRTGIILSKPSEVEYKFEYKENDTEIYYEVKDEYGSWSFGSFIFGIGAEKSVFARGNLFVEPQLRINFNSDIPNNYKNHGIGLRIGLMYDL